ncbi:mannose-1-phosphate guanylyltransferase/mannose-6-phosphate isomerase [Inquilinus sp. CAU 1745]|uniref:mannose-1-phosphate guanylyltransferase/mannose-6-phosphate isomerase n=1 Tax=Inquilinus sp. CAU 1745 TaxID=3140369 RepID=UPI00325A7707
MPSERPASPRILPVILSGGIGSRLWPLSRPERPKQLLSLLGEETLLQQTARRVSDPALFEPPIVICATAHRFMVAEQMTQTGIAPRRIVLEPMGRSTAPAAAVAAHLAESPDTVLAILPSDAAISGLDIFLDTMRTAAGAAAEGYMTTLGIQPDRPATGYGYIRSGRPLGTPGGACHVDRFVEKPDLETAERFLSEGGYYWNSGIFLLPAGRFLEELERHEPGIVEPARDAIDRGRADEDFLRLDEASFAAATSISIDHAVMERTDRAAVVPALFEWSDLGSWAALWAVGDKDDLGNVVIGDVRVEDSSASYLRASEGHTLGVVGVRDLVIVATPTATLVLPRDRAEEVKKVLGK